MSNLSGAFSDKQCFMIKRVDQHSDKSVWFNSFAKLDYSKTIAFTGWKVSEDISYGSRFATFDEAKQIVKILKSQWVYEHYKWDWEICVIDLTDNKEIGTVYRTEEDI